MSKPATLDVIDKGEGRVERVLMPGVIASISPFDDCCFRLSIVKDGEEVETGIWCPQSSRVAIGGDFVGFASTREEVLKGLNCYTETRFCFTG